LLGIKPVAQLPAHIQPSTCTTCGACCASFRVDFPEEELQSQGGCVPDTLADEIRAGTFRLRGTDYVQPRCAALQGTVGVAAWCGLHEYRPNVCRDFAPFAAHERFDEACNRARARHGLPAQAA
jgi:uncharacterized protein